LETFPLNAPTIELLMFGNLTSTFQAFVEFRAIDELTKPLREIQTLSEKTRNSLQKLTEASTKLTEVGAKLTAFFGGLTAPFGVALNEAIEFEKVFIGEFNKVVGASGKELQDFKNYFVELSEQIPLTATEIAQLSAGLAQMGIPTDQLKDFTKLVAQAAFAFDITAEEAGKAFGEIRNAFGIKTISELRAVGDTINYLSNTMGASAADLVDILKRVGSAAKLVGLDAKSVAVFAATIREAGYAPELVSSALSVLFQRLATFDDKTQQVVKTLGWTKEQFLSLLRANPEKAIVKLLTALKGLEATKRASLLKELVGAEHFPKIAVLLNNLDKLKGKLSEIGKGAYKGSMEQELQGLLQTTSAQLQLLKNTLTNIAVAIGSILLPPFNLLVKFLQLVITPIANFINAHQTLASVILLPIVAIGGLIALLGILATAFGVVGIAVTKGLSTLVDLKNTLLDLKGGFKELLPHLRELTLSLYTNARAFVIWAITGRAESGWIKSLEIRLSALKLKFLELTATVRANAVAMATSLRSYLNATTLKTALTTLSIHIRQIGTSFLFAARAGLAFVLSPIGAVLTAISLIAVFVALNIGRIRRAFRALYDFIVTNRLKPFFEGIKIGLLHAQKGIQAIKSAFKPLGDALAGLKRALGELLKPFKPLLVAIGKLFGFDGSTFKGWLEAGVSLGKLLAGVFNVLAKVIAVALKPIVWILTLVVKLITLVVKGISWVINGFRKLFGFLSRPFNLAKNFVSPFKVLGGLIWGAVTKVKSALNWLLNLFRKAFNFLKKLNPFSLGKWLIEGLAKGIKSAIIKPIKAIKEVGHKVVGFFKGLLGIKSPSRVFMGFGLNLVEGLFEGIRKLQSKPLEAISKVAKTLKGAFEKVFPTVVGFETNQKVEGRTLIKPIGGVSKTYSKSVVINKLIDRLEVVVNGSVKGEPKEIAKAIVEELESSLESVLWRF